MFRVALRIYRLQTHVVWRIVRETYLLILHLLLYKNPNIVMTKTSTI